MLSLNKKRIELRIGIVYLDSSDYEGDKYKIAEMGFKSISKFAEEKNVSLKIFDRKIRTIEDASIVVQQVEKEKIDFLILLIGTFPNGEVLLPILSKSLRMGLWSVPEPKYNGRLSLNSLLGTELAISTSKEFLNRTMPIKYFLGWLDNPEVRKRFEITFKALKGLKSVENSKIGLLIGQAPGFYDLEVNRKELKKLLNIEIIDINYKFIKEIINNLNENKINERIDIIKSISPYKAGEEEIKKAAQIDLSIQKILDIYNLDAAAICCFTEILSDFGAAPCSSIARLTQEGTPIACESDILGAIDMLILKEVSEFTPALMDLIAMDEKDESVCLWHCGAASPNLTDKACELRNIWWGNDPEERTDNKNIGAIYDLKLSEGDYTIFHSMSNGKKTFIASGNVIPKKDIWTGGGGWFGNLSIGKRSVSAKDFINSVIVQGVPHHFGIARGDLKEELLELVAWKGIKVIPAIPYSNYLINLNTEY